MMKKNLTLIGILLVLSSVWLFANSPDISWGSIFKKTTQTQTTPQATASVPVLENLGKSQKTSETVNQTDAQIADRLDAIAVSLDEYAGKVEKMENDLGKIHFGIGAGVEYKQDLNFGASVDFSVRKRNLLFVGGVTYYPINDLNIKDAQRIGGHASMLWEF